MLLKHGMTAIEKIFEKWLSNMIKIDETHMGFIPEKGTIDAIFRMRQMLEKYEMAGRKGI